MSDIVLEALRILVLVAVLAFLLSIRHPWEGPTRQGWRLILFGFALLLFGSILDLSDNFESLNRFLVVGNTPAEAILEKLVGFLGGFLLLAAGLSLLLPSVHQLVLEVQARSAAEATLNTANRRLLENERRFSALASNIPGAIYRIAYDGEPPRFDYLSDPIATITGYPPEHFAERGEPTLADLVHPDDRAGRQEVMASALAKAGDYGIRYRVRHRDGTWRWVADRARAVESDGETMAIDGALFDVTLLVEAEAAREEHAAELEQRIEERTREIRETNEQLRREIAQRQKTEAALQQNEARFREIFEQCPAAILEEDWRPVKRFLNDLTASGVTDLAAHFTEHPEDLAMAYNSAIRYGISQAAVVLYRARDKEELRWSMSSDIADPDELAGYGAMVAAFYNGAESFAYEAEEVALDGSPIVTHIRAVIPPQYRQDWSRVLVTIEDISARKWAEDRLQQAERLQAMGQLTGGVAHDFNNLLAVISGNAELLAEELAEGSPYIDALLSATERASDLTSQLLAYSRKQPLRPRPTDLHALVVGLADALRRSLGPDIELQIETSGDIWPAQVDPGQLETALLNMTVNSREAMPSGGRLTVEIKNARADQFTGPPEEMAPGDHVLVILRDTGTGIEPGIIDKVTEPFFTTKDVGEGSGLGLSMAQGFAKQSGGDLLIESTPGEGTTIRLYLPRALAESMEASPGTAKRGAVSGERPRDHTILVLEDDPAVRELTVNLVRALGYSVVEAGDGQAALDHLARNGRRISLLLTDVVLPGGLSGPEVAKRAIESNPDLAILFMSGYADKPKESGVRAGLNAPLLDKPFRKAQLAEAIRRQLQA